MLDAARPRPRRAVDPLVRSATTFVVRRPLWGLTIGVATAALALAASTAPLVTEAAADRAFHQEALAAEGAPPGRGIDARGSTAGLADETAAAAVTERLDALDVYGPPAMSVRPIRPYSGLSESNSGLGDRVCHRQHERLRPDHGWPRCRQPAV